MRPDRLRSLRDALEGLRRSFPFPERLRDDPVAVLHGLPTTEDVEVAGLVAASLALGRAASIRAKVRKLLDVAGPRPAEFVRSFDPGRDAPALRGWSHRWYGPRDMAALLWLIRQALERHGSLGACFRAGYRDSDPDVGPAITRFVADITSGDPRPAFRSRRLPSRWGSLLATPDRGSACKRMCLYLRWMIRPRDGVDLGRWITVPAAKLVIPLDVHIVRISRRLRLTRRRSPGWPMAVEVTRSLRRLDPEDPVKYDFLLCHLGMMGACPWDRDIEACPGCGPLGMCVIPGAARGALGRASGPAGAVRPKKNPGHDPG